MYFNLLIVLIPMGLQIDVSGGGGGGGREIIAPVKPHTVYADMLVHSITSTLNPCIQLCLNCFFLKFAEVVGQQTDRHTHVETSIFYHYIR